MHRADSTELVEVCRSEPIFEGFDLFDLFDLFENFKKQDLITRNE